MTKLNDEEWLAERERRRNAAIEKARANPYGAHIAMGGAGDVDVHHGVAFFNGEPIDPENDMDPLEALYGFDPNAWGDR